MTGAERQMFELLLQQCKVQFDSCCKDQRQVCVDANGVNAWNLKTTIEAAEQMLAGLPVTGGPLTEKYRRAALQGEHQRWAALFGEALVLFMQGDDQKLRELARTLRFCYPDGSPHLYSEFLQKEIA